MEETQRKGNSTVFSESSFYYCKKIQQVILPDNVTRINRDNTCPYLSFVCNYGTVTWETLSAMTGVSFIGVMPDGTIVNGDGKLPISECEASLSKTVVYYREGYALETPVLTLVDRGVTLIEGKDYTVIHDSWDFGPNFITYKGIGDYSGTDSISYMIVRKNTLTVEQSSVTLTAPYSWRKRR